MQGCELSDFKTARMPGQTNVVYFSFNVSLNK